MKLRNHTLLYVSALLLAVIGVWAVIFYMNMLDEVHDSIDDGLENYKALIIRKAQEDTTVLHKTAFGESNYRIQEITWEQARQAYDRYNDTLMFMESEQEDEPVRILTTVFANRDRYYELKIISSMVEEDDLVEDLLYSLIWLYIAIIASMALVNILVLNRIWKPFYHLLEELKRFRLDSSPGMNLPETDVTEFRQLNDAVSGLIKRTVDTYTSQKQFIENAAHELQTPVAISINKLELLSEKSGIREEELKEIGNIIHQLERLRRLNKSLLLISKIENHQFTETEQVSVNELAKRLREEYADIAAYKNISLSLKENASLQCVMHSGLAEILLGNLIKNAIYHNVPGGRVHIEIEAGHFSIRNTGHHTALDQHRMFTRFNHETKQEQSTGLGLAIAKAIADLYTFRISYSFNGEHIFTVSV